MTEQEQDAILGRVVREHKEVLRSIGILQAEISKLADEFSFLGLALKGSPEGVVLDGDNLDQRFAQWRNVVRHSLLDANKVRAITNEYRTALLRKQELEQQLELMGFDVRDKIRIQVG